MKDLAPMSTWCFISKDKIRGKVQKGATLLYADTQTFSCNSSRKFKRNLREKPQFNERSLETNLLKTEVNVFQLARQHIAESLVA